MRPFLQIRDTRSTGKKDLSAQHKCVLAVVLLAMGACTLGCGGGGAGSVAPPPPPTPSISVSVTPNSGSVLLGESLKFSATVSNTSNLSVTWSVNGVPGGSTQSGTITAAGVYTAPVDLPPVGTLQVTATSEADTSKSASAAVTVTSDISVSLSPGGASIELGATVSTEVGQILDADIYFNPSDSLVTFATPAALSANPKAYDLESLLIHEFGHLLGFSHSAVWSAIMYPFAAAPGTFAGMRATALQPDAPLADDDRTGLRVLYSDPNDATYAGSIQGQILPANPLSLPTSPPGVSGIFGAHVVAVDVSTGNAIAGTLSGWRCQAPGPAQFDGTYLIAHLPVGRGYSVYAEPLGGVVLPTNVSPALTTLCRNATTDPGWPPAQSCVVPAVDQQFTVRLLPAP
jgi:hypothetical protein